ncbi:MAG TPA: Spy/CpxP family protein refolding chaperone [Terracidiphilus sp.]|nr:Spy/CpxP family protein refolding chaperone [Terracidiphilus sp.]
MNARIARWLCLAVFGLAAVFVAAPGAVAQGAGGGQGVGQGFAAHRPQIERSFRFGGRFWDNPRVATVLKITPDQQKAMDDILFQHREKLIDLRANLQKAELDMEPLMNADEPNRTAIEAQIDKVVAARAALEKANSNFLLDIRMKLTPDQWKQIKSFRAEARVHGMHREWGPGGAGQRMRMHGPNAPGDGQAPQPKPAPQYPSSNNPDSGTGPAAQQ